MVVTQLHKNLTGADAIHPASYVQVSDPGSVGANKLWIDTSSSPATLKYRNAGNTAWVVFATGPTGATGTAGTNGSNGTAGAAGPVGPAGALIVSGAAPYANVQDQRPQNTNGGTFTSGAWRTRTLNTVQSEQLTWFALAANQITLQPGTYRCAVIAPVNACNFHQTRLQNVTDNTTVILGQSMFTSVGGASSISGRFALQSAKTLEVQHQCSLTRATDGLGTAANFGVEVYCIAEFWLEGGPPPFMGRTFPNPGLDNTATRALIADLAGGQTSLTTLPV